MKTPCSTHKLFNLFLPSSKLGTPEIRPVQTARGGIEGSPSHLQYIKSAYPS